jgi:hypothetical protein
MGAAPTGAAPDTNGTLLRGYRPQREVYLPLKS